MASSGPSQILLSLAHNADAAIKNNPRSVSREAPEVVVELSGSFPARTSKRKLFSFPPQLGPREVTLEALQEQLSGLAEVLWLKGVLFRAAGLQLDLTTAGALRNQLEILKGADKQVSIYLTRLDLISYYLASDLIWREVVRIKRSKPVVAVMGGVTASGGYYVLTHAAQVIASPTTLTGSIGVLTGKFVLEGFNTLYGFNSEALSRGRFALSTSAARPFSRKERALQERSIAEIYERFTSRVAAGRGLTQAQVDELGWGRVWTGRDAHALGLVDDLGDLELGIARAKELAGLPRNAPVWNVSAPAKMLLPTEADPTTLVRIFAPLQQEHTLLIAPLPTGRG